MAQDLSTCTADAFITVAPCCNNVNDRAQIVGFSVDSSFNMRALLWQDSNKAPVVSLVLDTISPPQKNTRRNATGNSYNTAPLSFNPMSHVGTDAQQSSQCRCILRRPRIYVNEERENKTRRQSTSARRWLVAPILRGVVTKTRFG